MYARTCARTRARRARGKRRPEAPRLSCRATAPPPPALRSCRRPVVRRRRLSPPKHPPAFPAAADARRRRCAASARAAPRRIGPPSPPSAAAAHPAPPAPGRPAPAERGSARAGGTAARLAPRGKRSASPPFGKTTLRSGTVTRIEISPLRARAVQSRMRFRERSRIPASNPQVYQPRAGHHTRRCAGANVPHTASRPRACR